MGCTLKFWDSKLNSADDYSLSMICPYREYITRSSMFHNCMYFTKVILKLFLPSLVLPKSGNLSSQSYSTSIWGTNIQGISSRNPCSANQEIYSFIFLISLVNTFTADKYLNVCVVGLNLSIAIETLSVPSHGQIYRPYSHYIPWMWFVVNA